MTMDEPTRKPGLDRRALLTGAAIGAVGAGAVAVGVGKLQATRAKLVTPEAVEGGPAQIGEPSPTRARHTPAKPRRRRAHRTSSSSSWTM
jgi:hypothetical protein